MNRKLHILFITLCAIAILSLYTLPIRGDTTDKFTATPTPIILTPTSQFSIPTTNGTIKFAQAGFYENATLIDYAWVFNNLNLDLQQTGLLSDSSTFGSLNITAQDSNVTITSFERLLAPDTSDSQNLGSWLTPGWLNYTVAGVGEQTIKMQFYFVDWNLPSQDNINGTYSWPMGIKVYIDGEEAQYDSSNWKSTDGVIPYGTGLIISGAQSGVCIRYAWVPIPSPVNQSPTDSTFQTTNTSADVSLFPYLLLATLAGGIIIPAALFINRHRLVSIVNKRIKRKQNPAEV
ncbi:MAG: hypothetical protein ACQCN4_08795 [Candidatus Bathyarchaeia archaeon]|jgi:hypothetical protein